MGVVWRGRDLLLDRDVAVKEVVLTAALREEERANACQRTLREARTAARLSHRGVVTVYDVAEEDGRPWIVMELVPSRSLESVLASDGPLTPQRAGRIGQQLLAALAAAHAAGVLHRDVKPSNVLISSEAPSGADPGPWDERAVLTDFGIAQFEGDPRLTQTGMVMGSPGFTAPERIRGGVATPASDLWSLGGTIYAAVEGRGPYEQRGGAITTMTAIINEDAPVAPSAGALGPVIAALLRREPSARPTAALAAKMFADVMPLLPDRRAGYVRTVSSPSMPVAGAAPAARAGDGAGAVDVADSRLPAQADEGEEAPAELLAPPAAATSLDALLAAPAGSREAAGAATDAVQPVESLSAPAPLREQAPLREPAAAAQSPMPAAEHRAPLAQPVPSLPASHSGPPVPPQPVPSFSASRPVPPDDPPTALRPGFPYGAPEYPATVATGDGPGPAPASPRRRGRKLAIVAAAITVAAAIGGGAAALLRQGHHGTSAGSAGSAALTSLPQSVQAIDKPSSALPSGWNTAVVPPMPTTRAGFRIGVPPGWQVQRRGLTIYLNAPDGLRYMEIDLTQHTYDSMPTEARYIEARVVAQGSLPGYKRLSIKAATIRGTAGAFWSFTWVNARNGPMRVDDLLFVERSQSYAIYYTAPVRLWTGGLTDFDKILRTFEPVG
jgi:hypothetical protein